MARLLINSIFFVVLNIIFSLFNHKNVPNCFILILNILRMTWLYCAKHSDNGVSSFVAFDQSTWRTCCQLQLTSSSPADVLRAIFVNCSFITEGRLICNSHSPEPKTECYTKLLCKCSKHRAVGAQLWTIVELNGIVMSMIISLSVLWRRYFRPLI